MPNRNDAKRKTAIDRLADAAMPKFDDSDVSERRAWWWIFFMPGKVILWIEYMFPHRLGGVFGSARRRNVPLIQVLYSMYFYIAVFVIAVSVVFIFANSNSVQH